MSALSAWSVDFLGAPSKPLILDLSEYLPRPVRYRLGELLLGEWRPRLAIAFPEVVDDEQASAIRRLLPVTLPPQADGVLLRNVPAALFPVGIRTFGAFLEYVPRHDPLYLVDIAGSFDEYMARNFSAKARQNLTRAARRVTAMAGKAPAWSVYTDPAEIVAFHREAAVLSEATYQYRVLKVGLDNDEATLQYLQNEAVRGQARGYLLKIDGQTIAFAWCRGVGRRLVYETIGYSTDHAALSPGNVLLYFILVDLFGLGRYNCLDFGSGEAAYKAVFSTRKTLFVDAYFFRPGFWNRSRVAGHFHLYRASVALSHALDRWGVKKQLKAIVRKLHRVE